MAKDNAIVKEVDPEDANWTNIIDLNFRTSILTRFSKASI
jgi:hypothetical protein